MWLRQYILKDAFSGRPWRYNKPTVRVCDTDWRRGGPVTGPWTGSAAVNCGSGSRKKTNGRTYASTCLAWKREEAPVRDSTVVLIVKTLTHSGASAPMGYSSGASDSSLD